MPQARCRGYNLKETSSCVLSLSFCDTMTLQNKSGYEVLEMEAPPEHHFRGHIISLSFYYDMMIWLTKHRRLGEDLHRLERQEVSLEPHEKPGVKGEEPAEEWTAATDEGQTSSAGEAGHGKPDATPQVRPPTVATRLILLIDSFSLLGRISDFEASFI